MEQLAIHPEPIDFHGLSYSPALLLDARLGAAITDDPEFRPACKWSFDELLWEMRDGELASCMERGVREFVRGEMLGVDPIEGQAPLVMRVGVVLGSLSALALVQYEEAKEGLQELMRLLERL